MPDDNKDKTISSQPIQKKLVRAVCPKNNEHRAVVKKTDSREIKKRFTLDGKLAKSLDSTIADVGRHFCVKRGDSVQIILKRRYCVCHSCGEEWSQDAPIPLADQPRPVEAALEDLTQGERIE